MVRMTTRMAVEVEVEVEVKLKPIWGPSQEVNKCQARENIKGVKNSGKNGWPLSCE